MREIVLDTETTGLDPNKGHRLVEIGAVEISNLIPTGRIFHVYINPERDMPEEAFRVHGLSAEFLAGQKRFIDVADEFLGFVEDAPLIIHNAEFDMGFINAELGRLSKARLGMDRVVDTLTLARRRHPGASNSLDALCSRYGVDASRREKHGALLDATLLAEVYAELMGGRQAGLQLQNEQRATAGDSGETFLRVRPAPLAARLSAAEDAAHREFTATLGKAPIWKRYEPEDAA
jgi:DNA polymerase III subunit epsilon